MAVNNTSISFYTDNVQDKSGKSNGIIISDEVVFYFRWIIFSCLCDLIDLFGILTNIINIVCFVKQGFQDSINISLLGLAVSDLCSLVTLIVTNVCYCPAFENQDLPVVLIELHYLTGVWPHLVFTRVTSWITAFITMERCLCIALPMKVKALLTTTRVKVIIVCIFTTLIVSVAPAYYANVLQHKFSPELNRSIYGIVFAKDSVQIEAINFAVNCVFVQLAAFGTVIVCTVTLVIKLRSKTIWRKKLTSSEQVDLISSRDNRVIKMVVVISTFFIACFTPISMVAAAMLFEPELSMYGRHRNVLIICSGVGFVLESTNSSVNFFIYYYMSSKYRTVFRSIFNKKRDT